MGFKRALVRRQKGIYCKSIRRLLEAKRACISFEPSKKKFINPILFYLWTLIFELYDLYLWTITFELLPLNFEHWTLTFMMWVLILDLPVACSDKPQKSPRNKKA